MAEEFRSKICEPAAQQIGAQLPPTALTDGEKTGAPDARMLPCCGSPWLLAVSCAPCLPAGDLRPTQGREPMEMALTAVFKKVPEGYIGFVEELPGANTQGATLEEARENLREAVELVLEANRALAREEAGEGEIIREPLKIAAG